MVCKYQVTWWETCWINLCWKGGNDKTNLPPAGCHKHEHGNRGRACMLCPKLKESRTFTITFKGLQYNIRHSLSCKSTFVVYLVTCKACSSQYTGKTTEAMHKRHTGHRREIEDQSTPLGRHFAKCGYQIVEGIWQKRLATFEQHGNINVRDELSRNCRSTALDFFDL